MIGGSRHSNVAKGRELGFAQAGAERDHLPGSPVPTGPAGPSFQNVCGPDREIEPLVGGLSSRGALPGNGPHARSDRFPGRSLQPRAERHSPVGVSVQERSALTLGRPLHPHHEEPSRAHAVQRRDPQEAAKFWVSARRKDASARNGEVPQGLVKLSTHRRIPSVMRRNICDTASRVMGKNKRNVP